MLHRLDAGDVNALHRTRVASRRLREVLPVLHLESGVADKMIRRLRKVTERLGPVRELDVMMLVLHELHETERFSPSAIARVSAAIEDQRVEARQKLAAKLSVVGLRRIGAKLARVASQLKADDEAPKDGRQSARALRWAIEARCGHRATRLHRAIDEAGAVYLPDRLHLVRIALKKLRYALELSAEADGVKRDRDVGTLKRAQDVLGRLHDLQMLINRVRDLQARTPPDGSGWRELDALIEALEDMCRRLHGRYMRQRSGLLLICERHIASPARRPAARRAG